MSDLRRAQVIRNGGTIYIQMERNQEIILISIESTTHNGVCSESYHFTVVYDNGLPTRLVER
jgi:hypothetical protein